MKQQPLALALGAAILLSFASTASGEQPDPNRVLVKFRPGAAAQAEAALKGAGGKVHRRLEKHRVIGDVREDGLAALIEELWFDGPKAEPSDRSFGSAWETMER